MSTSGPILRKRLVFHGRVQGVGFRWRARAAAQAAGVTGWVRNNCDGSVTMELQGSEAQIDRVIQTLDRDRYIRIAKNGSFFGSFRFCFSAGDLSPTA